MTTDVEKQEGQKTVVSFAAGLLIGGLLVWAFSGSPETDNTRTIDAQNNDDTTEETSTEDSSEDSANTQTTGETSNESPDTTTNSTDETAAMEVGDASVELTDTSAGSLLTLDGATFPTAEGWIGVRTYTDGTVGSILGVSRYSEEQGLIPSQIELLSPMVAGRDYAVVFFSEDGDRDFNPALDAQLDTTITDFTAK